MKKRGAIIIGSVISVLVLGTYAFPFLPVSEHVFLRNYENTIQLNQYDIKARILLFANQDKTEMRISGYFTYPAAKLINDGCFIEVSVKIEGQTPQKYPAHIVNTEYEKNSSIENISDSSIDDPIDSKESRRLILTLYNEPIVDQIYILELKPISTDKSKICRGTKIIEHKAGYYRASPAELAMGV